MHAVIITPNIIFLQIGVCSRGITANGRPHHRGNTAYVIPVTAVIPQTLSPLPRDYRGYGAVPAVPITVQLSIVYHRILKNKKITIIVAGATVPFLFLAVFLNLLVDTLRHPAGTNSRKDTLLIRRSRDPLWLLFASKLGSFPHSSKLSTWMHVGNCFRWFLEVKTIHVYYYRCLGMCYRWKLQLLKRGMTRPSRVN